MLGSGCWQSAGTSQGHGAVAASSSTVVKAVKNILLPVLLVRLGMSELLIVQHPKVADLGVAKGL